MFGRNRGYIWTAKPMFVATMLRRSLELILLKSVDFKELTVEKGLSGCCGAAYAWHGVSRKEISFNANVSLEREWLEDVPYALMRIQLEEVGNRQQIWCAWINQHTLEVGVTEEPTTRVFPSTLWRIGTRDSFREADTRFF